MMGIRIQRSLAPREEGRGPVPVRRVVALTVAAIAAVVLVAVSVAAAEMMMMGSPGQYPNFDGASKENRAKATRIVKRTNAYRSKFDTVREAQALGYSFSSREDEKIGWPAVRHMRKNAAKFWGKVLDPSAPQSLVWWCPKRGQCTLIASMYRAPGNSMPPTYGGLLMWHKHGPKGTWMTHVYYTPDPRAALARCVPFDALAQSHGVNYVHYRPDLHVDAPCLKLTANCPSMDQTVLLPVNISGSVIPAVGGLHLSITYMRQGGPSMTSHVVTDADGNYQDQMKLSTGGHWTVQALWKGNDMYEGTASNYCAVNVLP